MFQQSNYTVPASVYSFTLNEFNEGRFTSEQFHKAMCFYSITSWFALMYSKKRDGKFSFAASWMRRFISRFDYTLVKLLIDNGFLEIVSNHFTGVTCRKYRYVKETMGKLISVPVKEVPFNPIIKGKPLPIEMFFSYLTDHQAETLRNLGKLKEAESFIKELDH
jgi:hypothetical protein